MGRHSNLFACTSPLRSIGPSLIIFLTVPLVTNGAFFELEEGAEKCFASELNENWVLRVTYSMHNKEALKPTEAKGQGCAMFIRNPEDAVVKEHAVEKETVEGVLALVTKTSGRHKVCLTCPGWEWFAKKKTRWALRFDVLGENHEVMDFNNPVDAKRLASFPKFKGAQQSIDDAIARIAALKGQNEIEKNAEVKFVRTSEAVNTDVSAFKVVQILLVAGVTMFQIRHMSMFLRKTHMECLSCLPSRVLPRT